MLPRHRHAAADIEQDRQADRRFAGVELADFTPIAAVDDLEIGPLQVSDDPAAPIAHRGRDAHHLDPRPERHRRTLIGGFPGLLRIRGAVH